MLPGFRNRRIRTITSFGQRYIDTYRPNNEFKQSIQTVETSQFMFDGQENDLFHPEN